VISAIWTDFGGVLTPPVSVSMARFGTTLGVRPEQLRDAMRTIGDTFGTDAMAPLDTPLISEAGWSQLMELALLARHGVTVDLADYGTKWFAGQRANQPWVDWLRTARARGLFVGMLSNMVPDWEPHWRAMVPAAELFDGVVLSYEVGCRKPERAIFDLAAHRAGVPAGECVLVDDIEANCEAARAAGWRAIRFTDAAAAIAELDPATAVVTR
jgi:putative hydrolase of the HAD superfamily